VRRSIFSVACRTEKVLSVEHSYFVELLLPEEDAKGAQGGEGQEQDDLTSEAMQRLWQFLGKRYIVGVVYGDIDRHLISHGDRLRAFRGQAAVAVQLQEEDQGGDEEHEHVEDSMVDGEEQDEADKEYAWVRLSGATTKSIAHCTVLGNFIHHNAFPRTTS
jgi:hypothetical protein